MSGTTWLVVCSFTAPNGTALESYSQPSDTAATWTKLSSVGATVQSNELSLNSGGSVFYRSVPMTTANYATYFKVYPSSYTTVTSPSMWALARNAGDMVSGYKAQVSGNGTQYFLYQSIGFSGTSVGLALGTIASGYFLVELVVSGTTISTSCQRSQDGLWLQPSGTWASAYAAALVQTDSTYTAAGYVVIGGVNG